ncbi:CHAP domain-containing protein [Rhodocytophaga aerolata]|uniref:CHAP domain-containing protein n=1 Tax=Rhodocytophaga aerolata TaxID=455078 RepID=A0ABT8R1A3_9BACT|nr:CHAP domain-containing protein [Rhodocytophaga aerolata]MDO1445436.1 CHAP domain-containing protein [Rhodocytophaga aerolata]
MKYPGRVIKQGEADTQIVKAIQQKLNERNFGPLQGTGVFGPKTVQCIKLFQSLNRDQQGNPLVVDGKLGAISWQVLFGEETIPHVHETPNTLLSRTLEVAKGQIGIMEDPLGSNRGPQVDRYLQSVGLGPGFFWCMAFVYWCFNEASKQLDRPNPMVRTGGCIKQWNEANAKRIKGADAVNNPFLIKPGHVFIMDHGGGLGHTGIVTSVNGGTIHTIEGNSNTSGSRNGIGVVELNRKINSIKKGFLEYK